MKNKLIATAALAIAVGIACACCDKEVDVSKYAGWMQEFVFDIANYARETNENFIIIPQNGVELVYNETDKDLRFRELYMDAIDGIGMEELFYDGGEILTGKKDTKEKLNILNDIKGDEKYRGKKILVSDYVGSDDYISSAIELNTSKGFIAYPRRNDNYDYKDISKVVTDKTTFNDDSVTVLSEAKNYLYLISPENFNNKEALVDAIADTYYDLILIDLFFVKENRATEVINREDMDKLNKKPNGARRLVICYVNIGSAETFRYYWKAGWEKGNPSWIKKEYEGYEDEYWVKFWDDEWKDIIYRDENSYMKQVLNAGFDGAYLDNVEAYYFLFNK